MWILGFCLFVLSLRQGYYKYQMTNFAKTHIIVFCINFQIMASIANLYSGMVWLVMPAIMVIVNDIFAYLFGKTFGRTPLIELSKSKTWEGFIGGAFGTVAFTIFLAWLFSLDSMRF